MAEFYVCHNFVNQIRINICAKYSDFYSLTHHITNEEFEIFFTYNPAFFDNDALIISIIESAKSIDLFRYGWKAHRPLVLKRENLKFTNDNFEKEVVISVLVV